MILKDIFKGIKYDVLKGSLDANISNISYDSRGIKKNGLFFCTKGFEVDGHNYASSAVKNGAIALVVERELIGIQEDITIIKVENVRKEMAYIAANFYNNSSKNINLIGVTGTNGKTSITYLIETILNKAGLETGVIGTIGNKIGDIVTEAKRTTPEAIDLQNIFYKIKEQKIENVVMEVSSHSLDLYRVDGCDFNIGVFTNLTLDHLDYHKTMDNYLKTKAKLFKKCKTGIINIDDKYAKQLIDLSTCDVLTYGIKNDADYKADNVVIDEEGVRFKLIYNGESVDMKLSIPGEFSVYNALAAIGSCHKAGLTLEQIRDGLKAIHGVRGRFQSIKTNKEFSVIVDYAHAPDGLLNVLNTINGYAKGRVICVFGCGGDRDKTKRPVMGEIAGKNSDYAIITSDNPRTENPDTIISEIEEGIKKTKCNYITIADREKAIKHSIEIAKENDVILIAGKGHEDYQVIGKKTIHFDDKEIAEKYLEVK